MPRTNSTELFDIYSDTKPSPAFCERVILLRHAVPAPSQNDGEKTNTQTARSRAGSSNGRFN